ncbi:probable malonyl-CoA-acyl carrier protein transacylase, mitochondrial [Phymastichus coffea]|uniref:probable malonyl-CoA-acyl carrier protein transacylase, mitochondrial n=1 Tax=Phymastichus coffea TaxID=108790 RepID=UPI00273B247B|nr:probable malonyl-CoA-acyl carrier protein transacylase, mitochondrial [Phymastichus coffea]
MFQRTKNLKTIFNLSTFQKLRLESKTRRFFSETKDDNPSKEPENDFVSKLLKDSTTYSELNNTEWATTPYPQSAGEVAEDLKTKKPVIDPSETSVILFPGQGIIKVGDVKEYLKFPRVKDLFDIANDILGYDLLKMCLKGPQSVLDRTEFNQPATVVRSLAALEKLQEERPRVIDSCVAVAGYSVGELTALIFSGAMPYEEGLRLVAVRAAAMQSASEMSAQGMVSSYCTPTAKAFQICEKAQKWAVDIGASDPVCKIAIYLYTQGKVFGGSDEALQYIQKNSQNLGLKKVQRLPVSGAFHTTLMQPALKSFIKALRKTPFVETNVPVYSNYSTNTYTRSMKVNHKYLIKQIVSPVKWEQIIHKIYERPQNIPFPRTFDMGSKGTMKTILKMINAKAEEKCYVY